MITGFLGSGKTTFLQRVITHFSGTKKIAIVQNEFAPANFDGKELKRTSNNDFDLLEINNGSVFCVCLLSGFINSLHTFISKYEPEMVLMEASGLSDPVSIEQIFNVPKLQEVVYLGGSICIADARNINKFDKLMNRIHHQLQIADTILINKTDMVENTEETLQKINRINPFAKKHLTNHCNVAVEEFFIDKTTIPKKLFFVPGSSERPDVVSAVFRSARPIKHDLVKTFLENVIPKIIRLKGHILLDNGTTISVHAIADEVHTETISSGVRQTELIAMGFDISADELKDLYQHCM